MAKPQWLKAGLGVCLLLGVCSCSDAGASVQPNAVLPARLQDGDDARTASDASVQPSAIVADSSGYPLSPIPIPPSRSSVAAST